jgi:PadR family transcriptional regulator PadR
MSGDGNEIVVPCCFENRLSVEVYGGWSTLAAGRGAQFSLDSLLQSREIPYIDLHMAQREPRMSAQTLAVLGVLMNTSGGELSGIDISRKTKLASGTLYPILSRLELAGWLVSRWETDDPHALGRPRRRYYRVTGIGATRARAAFKSLEPAFGRPAWA